MKNWVAISILVLLFACKKNDTTSNNPPSPDNSVQLNQPYGNDPAQQMDIYLPQNSNTATTKFMVLLHGGGWRDGDKSEFTVFIDTLKKRFPDWAFFNINYRLYKDGANAFPAQEEDVKNALEFIIANSSAYGISKNHVLMGVSAGAHLALLQAYKNSTVQPKAVISLFGPTDLASFYNSATDPSVKLLLKALTGTSPDIHADAYQQSSPVHFVNESSPPTLLMHGDRDSKVPLSQSKILKTKLDLERVPSRLVIYGGQGHGWLGAPLTDSFNQLEKFLEEHAQ